MFKFPLPILAAVLQTALAVRCVCIHSPATLGVTNKIRYAGQLFKRKKKKKSSLQKVLRPENQTSVVPRAKVQIGYW